MRARYRILMCTAVVFFFCTSTTLTALAASPAHTALDQTVNAILLCVKDPGYSNAATRPALRARIEVEVRRIFDFEEFSSRTVGMPWRTFTPAQQSEFTSAFSDLMFSTYLDKVNGYNGERVAYVGETSNPAGDRVEVRTVMTLKDGKSIPIDYRMLPKAGTWRIYDVLVEGISLIKNYRTQFQDILSKGTPEDLIARVRERARVMQDKSNVLP